MHVRLLQPNLSLLVINDMFYCSLTRYSIKGKKKIIFLLNTSRFEFEIIIPVLFCIMGCFILHTSLHIQSDSALPWTELHVGVCVQLYPGWKETNFILTYLGQSWKEK